MFASLAWLMPEPQPTERKAAARVLGYQPCPERPTQ
jgi:hypothetical protein